MPEPTNAPAAATKRDLALISGHVNAEYAWSMGEEARQEINAALRRLRKALK